MIKWRNSIEIKRYFTKDNTDEAVMNVLNKLIPQLKNITRHESQRLNKIKNDVLKENLEYSLEELKLLIEEFEWIKDMIENDKNADEYSYSSWCEAFNEYLDQLYDLGDTIIQYKEKFLWVG